MVRRPRDPRARRAYGFIKAHAREQPIQTMCRVLDVAPRGYYEWLHKPISERAFEGTRLVRLIGAGYKAGHGVYGAPWVVPDLHAAGQTCGEHQAGRIMCTNKVVAPHLYRARHYSVRKRAGKTS